jgi:hypothetical protein
MNPIQHFEIPAADINRTKNFKITCLVGNLKDLIPRIKHFILL